MLKFTLAFILSIAVSSPAVYASNSCVLSIFADRKIELSKFEQGELKQLFKNSEIKIPKKTQQLIAEILSNYKSDKEAPQKIAEALGIKYLVHATPFTNLESIAKEGGLISGVDARKKYKVRSEMGNIDVGTYNYKRIFTFATDKSITRMNTAQNRVFLFFDISLLNRSDVGVSQIWNHGQRFVTFKDDPVGFTESLLNRFSQNEVSFTKRINFKDHLSHVVVKEVRRKAPRGMDQDMWFVPYPTALESLQKSSYTPKGGWESILFESNKLVILE